MPSDPSPQHLPPPPPTAYPWQARFFQVVFIGGLAWASLWLLMRLAIVSVPVLSGFFVAYALNPIVQRLRKWHVPPFLALTVPVLLVVSLGVVFFVLVVPSMGQELLFASEHLPQRLYNTVLKWNPWFQQHFGRPLSDFVPYQNLSQLLQTLAADVVGPADTALGWLLSSAKDILVGVGNVLLIVVVAFFLLDDYEKIVGAARSLVPLRHRARVDRVVVRIDEALAGFLRGQLLLMSSATVWFTVGMLALDVPFAFVMGPIAGVVYLIPYLGVLTGVTLSVVMSLLTGHSTLQLAGVTALFAAFYTVDLLYITPRLIGHRVGLKPVVVLLGIIAMGELAGLVGVLVAVPLLAVTRILLDEAIWDYRQSAAFLATAPTDDVPPDPPPPV